MTASDCSQETGKDLTNSEENKVIEEVARKSTESVIDTAFRNLEDSVHQIERALYEGDELTAGQVRGFREYFYELQLFFEEYFVPLVGDTEPYDNATMNLTYGQLADALDVDFADIERVRREDELEKRGKEGPENVRVTDEDGECVGVFVEAAQDGVLLRLTSETESLEVVLPLMEVEPLVKDLREAHLRSEMW